MLNKLWHNGIPSSTGIKQTTDTTWNNIDEAHKYNVKWKKKKAKYWKYIPYHLVHTKLKN